MEPEIQCKIRTTVVNILKDADMSQATEFKVRVLASMRLGIDLSDIEHKKFVREVVESYLLSSAEQIDDAGLEGETAQREMATKKEVGVDNNGNRFVCKLSNRRSITVHDYNGKSLVSIRDYYLKNGVELPSNKGISLTTEQWSVLRKSFGDVDSAITVMQSRLRSDLNGSVMDKFNPVSESLHEQSSHPATLTSDEQVVSLPTELQSEKDGNGVMSSTPTELQSEKDGNGATNSTPTELQSEKDGNGVTNSTPTELQSERVSNGVTTSTPCDEITNPFIASTSCKPVSYPDIASSLEVNVSTPVATSAAEVVARINVERFDGKNYKSWVRNMELFLKQLKVAHVLSEDRPRARGAEQKWLDEDHMCRLHILNSLSDSLYHQFLKTTTTAKELWDQLNQIYLFEDFGSKRAQVKKYIEFQIVDNRSIVDQVQELNSIADAIVAAGTLVQEYFHVSAVIAKLPPSWKSVCNRFVRMEHLPFTMLMEMIKAEEESRKQNKLGEFPIHSNNHHRVMNTAPSTRKVKRPSMQWKRQEMETDVEKKNRTQLCYCCGRKGHMAKQCPDRKFDNEAGFERHRNTSSSSSPRSRNGDGERNSWPM